MKFPKNQRLRDVWIKVCGNHVSWTPKRTSTICSLHFEDAWFITQANNKRKLKLGAFPSLNLTKEECENQPQSTSYSNIFMVNAKSSDEICQNLQSPGTYEICITEDQSNTPLVTSTLVKTEQNEDYIDPQLPKTYEISITKEQAHIPTQIIVNNTPLPIPDIVKTEKPDEDTVECQSSGSYDDGITKEQSPTPQLQIIDNNPLLYTSNTKIPNVVYEVQETLEEKRLKWTLQIKNTKIKRLQSRIRYLERKVEKLRDQLNKGKNKK